MAEEMRKEAQEASFLALQLYHSNQLIKTRALLSWTTWLTAVVPSSPYRKAAPLRDSLIARPLLDQVGVDVPRAFGQYRYQKQPAAVREHSPNVVNSADYRFK